MGLLDLVGTKRDYLKLGDGESVDVVFLGSPDKYFQKFGDKVRHQVWQEGLGTRYDMQIAVRDGKSFVHKYYSFGTEVKNKLKEIAKSEGDNAVIRISRTGLGKKDTEYTIKSVGTVTEAEKAEAEKLLYIPPQPAQPMTQEFAEEL